MMTKQSAALVLLLSVFAGSVLVTAVAGFCSISADDGAALERLGVVQGRLAPLFASSFVWSRYPATPDHLTSLVDQRALLTTIPLLLIALYFARIRGRRPFPLLIAICLAVALVPYVVGMIALHDNTLLEKTGPWLAIMLLGPLYALVACAVICLVELLRPDSRHRSLWGRLPLECPPLRTPAPRQ